MRERVKWADAEDDGCFGGVEKFAQILEGERVTRRGKQEESHEAAKDSGQAAQHRRTRNARRLMPKKRENKQRDGWRAGRGRVGPRVGTGTFLSVSAESF